MLYHLRPSPGEPSRPLASPNQVLESSRLRVASTYLEWDGNPKVQVSGEMQYSRTPRRRWEERLRLMKAGGLTAVACYIFWIHHEETRGTVRFDDHLDIAAFIEMAERVGLDVVLRIGPWVHGEARNGGLPDWVVDSGAKIRTNDPHYLSMVRDWFAALGSQVAPFCGPGGPVIQVQVDNELPDQPEHLSALKTIAEDSGIQSPLWTATGWGWADIPDEFAPLWGGYPDGFWYDHDVDIPESFRQQYYFTHAWDDPTIGEDLRSGGESRPFETEPAMRKDVPPLTCELGSGMAVAYQRRPLPAAADVAALANIKLGNGSAWQGYYVFVGATNPPGERGMQESHDSAYPNDMPIFDYEFHAPIGTTGRIRPSFSALRRQHSFLTAFGRQLAAAPSVLPDDSLIRPRDAGALRWAYRGDRSSGFVFIAHHQPRPLLADAIDVQLSIEMRDGELTFPDIPVSIPAGTIARWPVGLDVGGVRIDWATASPLTVLRDPLRTWLVVAAERRVPVRISIDGAVHSFSGEFVQTKLLNEAFGLLILPDAVAQEMWCLNEDIDQRELVRCAAPLWTDDGGAVTIRSENWPHAERFDPKTGGWTTLAVRTDETADGCELDLELIRAAPEVPRTYGSRGTRASAPRDADFASGSAVFCARIPDQLLSADGAELVIEWAGDVAQLRVDDVPVRDQFWNGEIWRIDLAALAIGSDQNVTLHILPLAKDAPIGLPAQAAECRDLAPGELMRATAHVAKTRLWRGALL